MDKIIELTKELKKELDALPLFQEYKRLKKLHDEDEELNELKKQIVRAKNENRLEEHKALFDKYESHPLRANYAIIEEEVREYLSQIASELNKK